jgi:L-serine dehydratase
LDNEIAISGSSEREITAELESRYEVMKRSAERALREPLTTVGSLITGVSQKHYDYSQKCGLLGVFLNRLMARALSCSETNAAMGKICACPTAGACGVVPAVIISLAERDNLSHETQLQALLTATGFGAVVMKNATVAGAEAGCQAECGVAAAMAAAAAVYTAGGTPAQSATACSIALMNCMGLICDPIAGLVQIPCAYRNASQAVNALLSADLAMGGVENCPIPADDAIDAMYKTGKLLPVQLRETALGGVAVTPSGKKLAREIFKK